MRLPEHTLLRWLVLALLTGATLIVLVLMAIILVGLVEGGLLD